MDKWLPSRKIVLIFGVLAIVVVGLFLIFEKNKIIYQPENSEGVDIVVSNILIKDISGKDTDNDGLKDWEEELWKTDLNNPDTDGDGVLDGDENLQKNPNSFFIENYENSDLSKTDKFSKVFIEEYVNLKKNNNLDEASVNDLLSSVIDQNINFNNSNKKKYSLKDINIVDSDNSSIAEYKNFFISLLESHSSVLNNKEYDLLIVENFLENKNPSVLSELEYASVIYNDIKDSLLVATVPNNIKEIHLNLLNMISNISLIVGDLSKIESFNDPVNILSNVKKYSLYEEEIIKNVSEIINYLN